MGDQTQLRQLHDAHAGALWAYVLSLTADRGAAEDVVQETLLRAWRQGITDTGHERATSARAWLFTVARHLVIDDARSARRRREVLTDVLPPVPDDSGGTPGLPRARPGADGGRHATGNGVGGSIHGGAVEADNTEALFDQLVVTDALRTLSLDHRAVVVRAYYGRQTVGQMADELDLPPGTVKSRLHYALRALRLALQERGVTR